MEALTGILLLVLGYFIVKEAILFYGQFNYYYKTDKKDKDEE